MKLESETSNNIIKNTTNQNHLKKSTEHQCAWHNNISLYENWHKKVMMSSAACVQLGFSEPIADKQHWLEIAHHSPNWKLWDGGKIGGKPSWINPRDIPQHELRCLLCAKRDGNDGTMLRFVAQIYSPADTETGNENAFHRTFYVFCCPHPLCSTSDNAHDSIVILRGQIAQKNDFYPYDYCEANHDNDEDNDQDVDDEGMTDWKAHKSDAWDVNLCHICGQFAQGKCPLANKYFCSKEHQRSYHKIAKKAKGQNTKKENGDIDVTSLVYAESELVVEDEPDETCNDEKVEVMMNKEPLFADSDDRDDDGDDDGLLEQRDLNQMTGINSIGGTSDATTIEFYSRIGRTCGDGKDVKSQCLRYYRWPAIDTSFGREEDATFDTSIDTDTGVETSNGPLWISSSHCPQSQDDIPLCQYCGAERKFEFQLMPQIINFLQDEKELNVTDDDKDEEYLDCNNSNGLKKHKGETDRSPNIADSHQALLAASDLIEKAKEEGKESNLPQGFEATQKRLVERLKKKVLNRGSSRSNDDIDFGTISVYSCTASCGEGEVDHLNRNHLGAYRKEFAWRQPPL